MLMNVLSSLMVVLTTVSTLLDPTYVVVDLDTHWLPTDASVKVVIHIAWWIIFGGANFHGKSEKVNIVTTTTVLRKRCNGYMHSISLTVFCH